jgi:hypothetical protein
LSKTQYAAGSVLGGPAERGRSEETAGSELDGSDGAYYFRHDGKEENIVSLID